MILLEGGIPGHMPHPYEVFEPKDLLDFVDKLFSGDLIGTEKVDGVNILLGLDNDKKIVFARNKTEEPFSVVGEKFHTTHPAHDAFAAALIATQTAFAALSDEELEHFTLLRKGQPNNFINTEILYGEVPNLIPYSKVKNYIVFHGFKGRKDTSYGDPIIDSDVDTTKLLNKLTNRLGELEISSNVVKFFGAPGGVIKEIVPEKSKWQFSGPVNVDLSNIKDQLDSILKELKTHDEYKALYKHIKGDITLTDEQRLDVGKELIALAGSKMLAILKSALADPDVRIQTGHPGIEGVVFKTSTGDLKDQLIKITGDFSALNQDSWEYLRNTIPSVKKLFTGKVLDEAFGVKNLMSITDASFKKYAGQKQTKHSIARAFLANRSKKYKKLDYMLDQEDINVYNILVRYATTATDRLSEIWTEIEENPDKLGEKLEQTKHSLLISAYQFEQFLKILDSSDTVASMFLKMLQTLFPIKFIRKTDGVVESFDLNEYDYPVGDVKRISIFIGKFDPAHDGHMQIVREMLHESDEVILFVSKVKKYLDLERKKEILNKYISDSGHASKVRIFDMATGFIPDLLKQTFTDDEIQETEFTVWSGSDRAYLKNEPDDADEKRRGLESTYKKHFTRYHKTGKPNWQYKVPKFRILIRDDDSLKDSGNIDNLLSLSKIPIKMMSSSLLRELVKIGTKDALRLFLNSQPTKDKKFIKGVWDDLKHAIEVKDG